MVRRQIGGRVRGLPPEPERGLWSWNPAWGSEASSSVWGLGLLISHLPSKWQNNFSEHARVRSYLTGIVLSLVDKFFVSCNVSRTLSIAGFRHTERLKIKHKLNVNTGGEPALGPSE